MSAQHDEDDSGGGDESFAENRGVPISTENIFSENQGADALVQADTAEHTLGTQMDQPSDGDQPSEAGGEEDFDDRESVLSELDPESPLLAPVQRRIEAQLRKHLEELTLRLHEAHHESNRLQRRREDVGVELYTVQQSLAKLQERYETSHEHLLTLQAQRTEREQARSEQHKRYEEKKERIEQLRGKYYQFQQENDRLHENLLKLERYHTSLESEIAVERRATYKAEEDATKLEKSKQKQDYLLDTLNERLRVLREQLALYTQQLQSQRDETQRAEHTLAEAESEMEAVRYEKKRLLQQWTASVIGMQRRDEALQETENALMRQREELLTLENNLRATRQAMEKSRQEGSQLSNTLVTVETEVARLERKVDELLEQKAEQSEKYRKYQKKLEQTEAENREMEKAVRLLEVDLNDVNQKIQKVTQEIHVIENALLDTVSEQSTLQKGSKSTQHEIERLRALKREKEMHYTNIENELSRIRIDMLETRSHNASLQHVLDELEAERAAKDRLVERLQQEIRRKHDEMERKQNALDALNKQYDALVVANGPSEEGGGAAAEGPLEATINNLSRAITTKAAENDALQRDWVRQQTELLRLTNECNALQDEMASLRSRATVLTAKKSRLVAQTTHECTALRQLKADIEKMYLESRRLNTELSKSLSAQDNTADQLLTLEGDLMQRLAEGRRQAVELESRIEQTRLAKQELLEGIFEAERAVLFWEKKIQIAKETELALDPTVGKEEVQRMKREIGVMEQRMGQLKREQQRMIEVMQRHVDHREVLRTKGDAIQAAATGTTNKKHNLLSGGTSKAPRRVSGEGGAAKTAGRGTVTRASVKKESLVLAREIDALKTEAIGKESEIKKCLTATESTAALVESLQQERADLEEHRKRLQQQNRERTLERRLAQQERDRKKQSVQRYHDAVHVTTTGTEQGSEDPSQHWKKKIEQLLQTAQTTQGGGTEGIDPFEVGERELSAKKLGIERVVTELRVSYPELINDQVQADVLAAL